jgi:hypothetical protein
MNRLAHALPRGSAFFAAVALVLGGSTTASAHTEFPGYIQDHFGLACAPQCTLCHVKPQGGPDRKGEEVAKYLGADNRGFGFFQRNMREGMVLHSTVPTASDKTLLLTAIDHLKTDQCNWKSAYGDTSDPRPCDSDGDGTSDYDEVRQGFDPDTKGEGNGAVCPTYGCGASISTLPRQPLDTGHASAALAALGVALVVARRFRR